jgi:hypothetical protein
MDSKSESEKMHYEVGERVVKNKGSKLKRQRKATIENEKDGFECEKGDKLGVNTLLSSVLFCRFWFCLSI